VARARNRDGTNPQLALELHNDGNGLLHISRPPIPLLEQHLSRMKTLESLLRQYTWFTEGTTSPTFRNSGTLGDGWLLRYGIDAAVHETSASAAAKKWGDEQIKIWRRSYDTPPPGGESLADTAARVIPYWESRILPRLKAGKNVLIGAHGNSLRALVMHLDGLSKDEVLKLEIPTGAPLLYELDTDGRVRGKRYL